MDAVFRTCRMQVTKLCNSIAVCLKPHETKFHVLTLAQSTPIKVSVKCIKILEALGEFRGFVNFERSLTYRTNSNSKIYQITESFLYTKLQENAERISILGALSCMPFAHCMFIFRLVHVRVDLQ
uniref:Uncharacterized protein n=1 Tax=Glossina pallidipes TaxID=7398 RepID=A0A1A9ZVF5_GLOPL